MRLLVPYFPPYHISALCDALFNKRSVALYTTSLVEGREKIPLKKMQQTAHAIRAKPLYSRLLHLKISHVFNYKNRGITLRDFLLKSAAKVLFLFKLEKFILQQCRKMCIFASVFCTLLVLYLSVNAVCKSLLPVVLQLDVFQVIGFTADVISLINYLRKEDLHMKNTISATLTFAAIPNGAL